jgi:hypothetical protein
MSNGVARGFQARPDLIVAEQLPPAGQPHVDAAIAHGQPASTSKLCGQTHKT